MVEKRRLQLISYDKDHELHNCSIVLADTRVDKALGADLKGDQTIKTTIYLDFTVCEHIHLEIGASGPFQKQPTKIKLILIQLH